jgi:uncharacterized membrane protein
MIRRFGHPRLVEGATRRLLIFARLTALAAAFVASSSAQLVLPTLLPDATQGAHYYQTLTPNAGNSPYHSLLTNGSTLPQGLQFSDTEYGPRISGTPEVFGQFSFTIEVSDASTPPIRQARQYHLTIHDALPHSLVFLATTLPDATYGAPYGPQILVTGGTYPYTASYAGSGYGFSFDRNASLISLGPVSALPGTYQILVTLTDSSSPTQRLDQTLTITVRAGISLAPVLLTGTVLQPYSDRIFVTGGGSAPYHFAVASGALPPGLQLDGTTGALAGTPTIAGTYYFQVAVTDSTGLAGALDYVLEILGLTLSMTPGGTLPTGRVGVTYPSTTFAVQGGVVPYSVTRAGGGVPSGMTLTPDLVLSGTPTMGGSYSFDFSVTDAIGDRGYFVYFWTIQDIAPATVPDAYAGAYYVAQLAPTGYSTACNLTLISGSLPPGISFVSIPAQSIYEPNRFYLQGTPTQAGAFTFTVEAQDPGGLPADRSYTLRVSLPRLTVSKVHNGHFSPGQLGAAYSVVVGNAGGGATTDAVTMSESVPSGLTLVSMSGAGWNCSGVSCTRSDSLNAYAAYPPITVTVNVAPGATDPQVNAVSVSGGGSPPASAGDSTKIASPLLSISKTHSGNFTQGQTNASYTALVSNSGAAGDTSGIVTVTETMPTGLALVSMAGAGWTCPGGNTCSRSDMLVSGSSYPPITVTVNVAANAPSSVTNQASVSGGGSISASASDTTVINAASGITATAAFVKTDTTTQGTWKSVYGSEGEVINGDTASYPSYAQVSFNGGPFVWVASTADVRGLQKVAASDRIASGWYSWTNMTIDVNLTDGNTHQIALYCLDWDAGARAERIDVLDAVSNAVLDTRTISGFQNGQYLVWNLKGHVKLNVTLTGGSNAVVSGVFFGASSGTTTATAAFVKTDTTTQGTWKSMYGADGEVINGDATSYPSYAQVSFNGGPFVWTASTPDVRGLQKVAGVSDRMASGWYSWTNMSIDVNLTDGNVHQVALYCLDWDAGARAERIDVLDAVSNAVLDTRTISGFQSGQYLVWNLTGHVKLKVTLTGGANAVVNGVFFGASSGTTTATAAFVKTDTTTLGTWKSGYGSDGEVINGDTASYPSYAQVSFNGGPFVWVASTADVRGLQKVAATDRIASGWYSWTNMSIDVNLIDGNVHQVALYCLDWDAGARAERIDVLDAVSNAVLDTRTISGFQSGQYLVWNLKGHVKLNVTLTGGSNAVVSGLFFGASSGTTTATAAFVKTDTTTQGTWKSVYGADGEAINGDTTSYPGYAQVSFNGGPFVWTASTADVRGLQKVAATDRIASGWYSWTSMSIDVNLTDGNAHQVALYCLDWDAGARAERIDVLDAVSNAVLDTRAISGFQSGQYLVWNLTGHVKLKVTLTGGSNAVVSGVFFR